MQVPELNPYAAPTTVSGEEDVGLNSVSFESMRTTRNGLLAVYYGVCVMILSMLAVPFSMMVFAMLGLSGVASLSSVFVIITTLGSLLAIFVGLLLCISVPAASQAKGYAVAAAISQATSVGGPFLFTLFGPAIFGFPTMGMNVLMQVTWLVGACCFLLFLRNSARYIGDGNLTRKTSTTLRLLTILIVAGTGLAIFVFLQPVAGPVPVSEIAIIMMGVLTLSTLIMFLRIANHTTYLAKSIKRLKQHEPASEDYYQFPLTQTTDDV